MNVIIHLADCVISMELRKFQQLMPAFAAAELFTDSADVYLTEHLSADFIEVCARRARNLAQVRLADYLMMDVLPLINLADIAADPELCLRVFGKGRLLNIIDLHCKLYYLRPEMVGAYPTFAGMFGKVKDCDTRLRLALLSGDPNVAGDQTGCFNLQPVLRNRLLGLMPDLQI